MRVRQTPKEASVFAYLNSFPPIEMVKMEDSRQKFDLTKYHNNGIIRNIARAPAFIERL